MTPDRFPHAGRVAVLADCHIHPAAGIDWPAGALERLAGADLIVTLGDMGEASGLDSLAQVAPLLGVAGEDDAEDPRTAMKARLIEAAGVRVGAVFNPMAAGLATSTEPLVAVDDGGAARSRLFGAEVAVVLYASTHDPEICRFEGVLWVNPGSLTLPNGKERGETGAFAWLEIGAGAAHAKIERL